MANGAGRIFNVLKNTAEEVSSVGSQYVTLEVLSLQPLKLKLGDKLEITQEFLTFSTNFNMDLLSIGSKVNAIVLNSGQLFYILGNNSFTNYLPISGGTLTGDLSINTHKLSFTNGGNVEWKENNYGDKFRIIPYFRGVDDDNKLKIQGTVGGAQTDPTDWVDVGTISAKNRKCMVQRKRYS